MGAPVKFDQLPGRPEDRRVPLPLPVFDVERAIHLIEAPEPLYHELASFAGCGGAGGLWAGIRTLAS